MEGFSRTKEALEKSSRLRDRKTRENIHTYVTSLPSTTMLRVTAPRACSCTQVVGKSTVGLPQVLPARDSQPAGRSLPSHGAPSVRETPSNISDGEHQFDVMMRLEPTKISRLRREFLEQGCVLILPSSFPVNCRLPPAFPPPLCAEGKQLAERKLG